MAVLLLYSRNESWIMPDCAFIFSKKTGISTDSVFNDENRSSMMNKMNKLPLVVEPEQLYENLMEPHLLIVDLCRLEVYQKIHIPDIRSRIVL